MELLLKRMESHPQEFYYTTSDHNDHKLDTRRKTHTARIDSVKQHWNRKEKRLYNEALRTLRMEEYHQALMKIILT